ncbi:MAG: response regulator transcription factor, partial [Myxococcota bacterium]
LERGADDYLAKPVAPRRLLARVAALLRRGSADAVLTNGPLQVDLRRRTAVLGERSLRLSTAEFDLLHYFVQHLGQVVSRDALYRDLRGVTYDGVDRSIDLRVSRLRKHLLDDPADPAWIKTVHGVGYVMAPVS